MTRLSFTLAILLVTTLLFSQKPVFQGVTLKSQFSASTELAQQFDDWEVYQLDVEAFDAFVKQSGNAMDFSLNMGNKYEWNIWLEPRDIRGQNYKLRAATGDGVKELPARENLTFRGHLETSSNSRVALTIDEDFVYGFIKIDNEFFFIEPLGYFIPGQPTDRFVVYSSTDVKPNPDATCGFEEMNQKLQDLAPAPHDHKAPGAEKMMGCLEVDLAIASDWLMFDKYGSTAAVEGHNFGVINNMQTNWDDEFMDELSFIIVEQFTVSTPTGDPWTSSTSASALLNSFTSWGPNGFTASHDLGELWTARNLNGGTVGIAWLSSVCNASRYHVLQDFTSNANLLRVLAAHEIGHNFSATHDPPGSGTIMAPSVNNTNTWSSQSVSQINNFYPTRSCLSNCVGVAPPVANFSADNTNGCTPMTVNFTDQSLNNPITWNWTFPGGSPSSSTDQNPTVLYPGAGTFNVTLTVVNLAGSNSITKTGYITVEDDPIASYSYAQAGLTLIFTNNSTPNSDSYLWEFGDGFTSTDTHPIHTYAEDGFYDVTLTAFNDCGQSSFMLTIPVFLPPSADFSADPTEGCASLEVDFVSLSSSNVTDFLWTFPGGTPTSSSNENPTVIYNTPGVYSVTLLVSNPAGNSTEAKIDYITVGTIPTPGFSYAVNGSTVTFVNMSDNSDGIGPMSFEWDFGDGNTSTDENPQHTYTSNGNFTVVLTATNDCGAGTHSETITIETPPTAGFSASTTSGCVPLTVNFINQSSANANTYEWTLPGGDPSTSSAEEPTVVYNTPGTFDVTLIVSNSAGADTVTLEDYITVDPLPTAGFTSSTNGFTATFVNNSADATSYSWDFGDGATSTGENPTHTYDEDGTYTVELTATNDCGTDTFTETITIITPPTAGFSANVTSGCASLTVQFSNESSENATSFEWDFPGGDPATSTQEDPAVTYDTPGLYTVTLTVSNAAGSNTHTETNYITVTTTPTAGFTTSIDNATVTFTNTSDNATSYSWDFGDGATSTGENPTHTYAEDGTYTVELTATNDCGSSTTTQSITIVTPPTAGFSANVTSGCAPLTVQFSNESSENTTSFEWDFPGGTPSSSTDENPTVTYQSAGTYHVTLTVSNSAGNNTVTEMDYIVVTTVPDPGFTVTTDVFEADFTNTTVDGDSYEWDFGDGATSTDEHPTHTYAGDGTYTVTLAATNDCGTSTFTGEVVITSLPQAGFSVASSTGCAPFTVQFMDESSSNSTSWEWEFPGGNPSSSTDQNPTVTYGTVGTYTVTLTVGNVLGENTLTETNFITVVTTPTAGFSSSVNFLTVDFTNTSADATSYEWNFGDGEISTDENPSHQYAEDGTYDVTLTATNDCGSVMVTETVTVVSLPTAGFSAEMTSGCAPFTVAFTNESSENATDYEWSFPGGDPATSTDENPTVTYNDPGVYDVTLTVSNAAGQDELIVTEYIVAGTAPDPAFTSIVDGATVMFTNNTTNPANSGMVSYEWDFGDGETSTDENPSHEYTEDEAYTVTLTATNDCGSVTVSEIVVIANQEAPIAAFTVETTAGCAPFEVTFENLSSVNAETFEWSFPGGDPATSTDENPTVVYNAPGVYDVTLIASNQAGSDTFTETAYIVVDAVPIISFTTDVDMGTVTFTNNSDNANSYEWNFGDGETSTDENPVHTYLESGEYTVMLTAFNDCGFATSTQTVIVMLTGVEELPGIATFNVYPNPNTGRFTMALSGEAYPELMVTFTNVLGQVVLNEQIDFRSGQVTRSYSFDQLAAGMYVFQVKSGEKALHKKVIVE